MNRRPPAPKAGALPGCATPRKELRKNLALRTLPCKLRANFPPREKISTSFSLDRIILQINSYLLFRNRGPRNFQTRQYGKVVGKFFVQNSFSPRSSMASCKTGPAYLRSICAKETHVSAKRYKKNEEERGTLCHRAGKVSERNLRKGFKALPKP